MGALFGALTLFRVTFYTLPGTMANGNRVHMGAAACSRWMPLGTHLRMPDGWMLTCEDRGLGDRYWGNWLDVWVPSYDWGRRNVTGLYGDWVPIEILEEDDDAT